MKKNINLFSFKNTVESISEADKEQLSNYLITIDAFSRTTYRSIYVIDYHTKKFDYVSENPLLLCGNSAEEVKTMGYKFYFKYVPEEDLELLDTINKIGFEYYDTIAKKERQFYTISYDFHLCNDAGNTFLINHKLTPLFLTESGNVWKAICVVSLSNNKEAGNICVYKQDDNRFWHYDLQGKFWKTDEQITLSEREREILLLSIQGYTINEVADKLFVSSATIKFHRKNLFDKLQVSNITEAIAFVTNNKLI